MNVMKKSVKIHFIVAVLIVCVFRMGISACAVNGNSGKLEDASEYSLLIEIDGRRLNFSDQLPVIQNGHTLIPVRSIFEYLGYNVDWDEATYAVMISNDINTVTCFIGDTSFVTNGTTIGIDIPACIINGCTMLPLRAVLESIGYSVNWDKERNTVFVYTDDFVASRLALIMLDNDGGGNFYEILSDGRINFCYGIGTPYSLTENFEIPGYIPDDIELYRNKQGILIGKVQKYMLSSVEFEILKELLDMLKKFEPEDINKYLTGNGLRYVHAIIDGGLHGSEYGSSYELEEGFENDYLWDNVLLHDIAYLLLDTVPHKLDKKYWSTPKDLVEQGELEDYRGLSTFYYRYNEEPKTRILYSDPQKIDNIKQWLTE